MNDLSDHSGSFIKTSGSSLTIFCAITQRHSPPSQLHAWMHANMKWI